MSNMAEVNGTDHLVRHEKETKLNGYYNEGYDSQDRSVEGEESANDEDRLRIVVTENGHRPESDPHLHNGHIHEDPPNGHSTTTTAVNGTAIIVMEESKEVSDMADSSSKDSDSSQTPLDTRLHHFVPVDDIDRRILNSSDGTCVTIPEDAVISFTTGRVKVKKGASNNPQTTNERESIPLETMLPSYEADDKNGLNEKAELEAELISHKNGCWSEGHHAYDNPEGPFGNSEKLNGTSKSSEEVSLPVNNHRKCLSSDASDTSSEQKSTGEKLYFTEENRKLCPGWQRVFVCGLILIILAVALLLGVLAATGILLAESESKNTRYESGHSLPSIDSVSHAGHSSRPRPSSSSSSSKVPQKFLPPLQSGNAEDNETWGADTVSPPPTVSSKVPVLNDTSHSQTIVPNALVGEFTITDENFTEDLKDSTSHGYTSLATHLEAELRRIFKRNGGIFQELKILNFSPGSIKVKFVTVWASDRNIILSDKAVEILKSYLRRKNNLLLAFPVDSNSIHFKDVFDECRVQKGGCSYSCIWDYNTLTKTCDCGKDLVLLADRKSCGPKPPMTATTEPTTTIVSSTSPKVSTSVTEPTSSTSSLEVTTERLQKENLTTTPIPFILTDAITSIIELFGNLTTTESPTAFTKTTTAIKNLISETTSSSKLETTTKPSTSEQPTTIDINTFTNDSHLTVEEITTIVPTIVNLPVLNISDNHSDFSTTENPIFFSNSTIDNATTFSPDLPTAVTEQYSAPNTESVEFVSLENSTDLTNFNTTKAIDNSTRESNTSNVDVLADSITTDLPSTLPSTTAKESNEITIGYHIETETIQVYTLKESKDFNTETVPVTSPEFENVTDNFVVITENPIVPSTKTNYSETNTETLMPDHVTEPAVTSDFPKIFVATESVKYDTTTHPVTYDTTTKHVTYDTTTQPVTYDVTTHPHTYDATNHPVTYDATAHETITEASHVTDKTIDSGSLNHEIATVNDSMLENSTDLTTLKNIAAYNISTEATNVKIDIVSTTLKPSANEETVTTLPPVSTVLSIPIAPQFNRTPGLRSFDNFTDYGDDAAFSPNPNTDLLSTDSTILVASTEVNVLVENSTSTESKLETVLTTNPVTTPVSVVELFPVTISSKIDDSVTTMSDNTELSSKNTTMYSSEATIPAFTRTIASTNFSIENLETTETPLEISTMRFHSINETIANNDSLDTTISVNETIANNNSLGTTILVNETIANNDFLGTTISVNETIANNDSLGITISVNEAIANNDSLGTIISVNNSEASTLPTTSVEPLNQTDVPGSTETVLNEYIVIRNTTENYITEVTTIMPINNASTDGLALNNTEIAQAYSNTEAPINLENETTTMKLSETTVSNMETNIDITAINITDGTLDSASSTSNVSETMTPTFTTNTLQPLANGTENNTMLESNVETTILPTTNNYEMNITTEEIFDNITISNLSDNITMPLNFTETGEDHTLTTVQDFSFPTSTYFNESEENSTEPVLNAEAFTTVEYDNTTLYAGGIPDDNLTHTISLAYENPFDGVYSTLVPDMNGTLENSTFLEYMGNFTTDGYENVTNETTTNASTGIECREDQFLCVPLNKCINDTFMCDGIEDCPDGYDEFECKDTCHSNFMCTNSSSCIMSDVRCDGIWDCENGTDEENCTPTECAKHEVMCLDGSKCIKPGHICDWKYNCLDRSDEVGCVERTTCESGGRFFCNDGLCIPWSLKCDGEFDCKEGEDEGNCTCLSDEFQCNDGKCLKSSSRCDGHQDCHDAGDEMGCVTVDSEKIVSTYEPYSGTWGLLCAEDWNLDDGQYLCQELGFGHVLNVEKVHVSFNGTWMTMRRDNLTDSSLWTERVSFVESCTSSLAARVECQKFACGEYTGLLHRRKRDVISSSSTQWPFIGYASTFHTNKGCLSEILTPIWLITSAECLLSISKEPFNGSDWYVRTNIGRNVEADLAQNHEVLRIISHSHSSKFRSLTLRDYDVALIRLKHALVFVSDKIGAICPPEEQVPPGITCFSGVLGTEKPRAPPPEVLSINSLALQIIDKGNCNKVEHFNNTINQRMLCTQSSEGHTICDNDEGTPLMCLTGINKWFLAGMLTYQRFCDVYNKHPAVFSNLFSMRKFLDQVTGQKQYDLPYDSSIYIIIPPTTPSPTVPETTTIAMTTTELTLFESTYPTKFDFENGTEIGIFNGTTILNEELVREEIYTTSVPGEFTTQLLNSTELYENGTALVHYGMKYDVINTTVEESDEISMNKTHHYLMSLPNETYVDSEANMTDVPILDNSTSTYSEITRNLYDLSNVTTDYIFDLDINSTDGFMMSDGLNMTEFMKLSKAKTTTGSMTLVQVETTTKSMKPSEAEANTEFIKPAEVEITTESGKPSETITIPEFEKPAKVTATTEFEKPVEARSEFIDSGVANITSFDASDTAINNTKYNSFPFEPIVNRNESLNSSFIIISNDSVSTFGRNETTEINQPMISILNESSEINQPHIFNESIAMSQPIITMFNKSSEMHLPFTSNESIAMSEPLISMFNESSEIHRPFTSNESIAMSQPLISMINESSTMHPPFTSNESISMNQPLISMFNESLEIHLPFTSNESVAMSEPLISMFNESSEMHLPFTSNESIAVNQPLISMLNESLAMHPPFTSNENRSTSQPLISMFNESSEMHLPFTSNESIAMSEPLIHMFNGSSEMRLPFTSNESIAMSEPLITMLNESSEMHLPFTSNESIAMSEPLIPMFNGSSEMHLPFTSNESIAMSKPLISMFNGSSEMHLPFTSNESIAMSQPLISMFNESSEMHLPFTSNESITTSQPLISTFNESSEMHLPIVSNETIDINQPFISNLNDSSEMHLPHLSNETITTSQPFILNFNESSEMFLPYIFNESAAITQPFTNINESLEMRLPRLSDDSLAINQPLISLNDSTERKAQIYTTVSSLGIFENNYTEFQEITNKTTAFDTSITFETTTTPHILPKTEPSTTVEPLENTNGSFAFVVDGEPEKDLAISIFNYSGGIKFEPYVLPENKENTYERNVPNTNIYERTYITTEQPSSNDSLPLIVETSLPVSSEFISNLTEFPSLIYKNESTDLTTLLEKVALDYTTTTIPEVQTRSAITTGLDVPYDSNTTLMPEVDTGVPVFTMKTHLISEKLTIIQDNGSLSNLADCGLWDENAGAVNTSHNERFFMTWPALGYLKMASVPMTCTCVVVTPTFVMTSLNCLLFKDMQLDPGKWAYVGGLYHPDIPNGDTQSHLVTEIIPYPDQNPPHFFYENNVALVRLKTSIKIDNFSKNACVPQENIPSVQKCFSTGWTRNTSDNDNGKQFFSVPVSILSSEECNSTANYYGMFRDSLICGNHKNANLQACQMDLGSPLFCLNENKQWDVQGVLSFPGFCGLSQPTVFSSVTAIRKWIIDTLVNDGKVQE